jgi:hypothetical protein
MRTVVALITLALAASGRADSWQAALDQILAVGHEGSGNATAAAAWSTIARTATPDDLPALAAALDRCNPLAANYLRAAMDAIGERAAAQGTPLPRVALANLLLDAQAGEPARWAAFDLLQRQAPEAASRLVPGFLHDPSPRLRRLAVARLLEEARSLDQEKDSDGATVLYRQALGAARDVDQIRELAATLEKRGQTVDLPRQFGFLMHWEVIAPFDNTGRAGFDAVFPPESEYRADAVYPGKGGDVRWQPLVTADPYGKVDFNGPYTMLKEVTGYARTVFQADRDQTVQLRLGCKNAWKIWLNGELIFGRDEYHRGQRIDQYILPAKLRQGSNVILVKCCQNEQTQDWTVQWEFQLRVCDASGAAVLAVDRPPTPRPAESRRRPADAK